MSFVLLLTFSGGEASFKSDFASASTLLTLDLSEAFFDEIKYVN